MGYEDILKFGEFLEEKIDHLDNDIIEYGYGKYRLTSKLKEKIINLIVEGE